jgi:hypothetical protein
MTPLDTLGIPLQPGPVSSPFLVSIERALDTSIPEGKRGVLLQVRGATGAPLAFGVAAKLGDGWRLAGDIEKTWGGPIAGVVEIVKVF